KQDNCCSHVDSNSCSEIGAMPGMAGCLHQMARPAKGHVERGYRSAAARTDGELTDGKVPVMFAVPRPLRRRPPWSSAREHGSGGWIGSGPVAPWLGAFLSWRFGRRGALMCGGDPLTRSGQRPALVSCTAPLGAAAPVGRIGCPAQRRSYV